MGIQQEKVQNSEPVTWMQRSVPVGFALMLAWAVNLPLLLMKLPLRSYDTNFHIFFASHYAHHWFDPWNTKWFAGFTQTTYPPLPQQWVALISPLFGFDMGYMAIQFVAILLLVVGVYRFSLLWVSPRAASFAALASVFLGSESFLVYSAGQLPTTTAAAIYLIALPYMYEWVRSGSWRGFLKAFALLTAGAAAHHFTLLFGSFFFVVPVLALALIDRKDGERVSTRAFAARTVLIAAVVGIAIAVVLLPFWIALIHNPVTQTPIPHPSRANYILSPEWGLNFFVVPYGAMILALPFIVLRGAAVARLRPLLFGFWFAFILGLGGTTPFGQWVLGRAFNVLTMERFTYWATLLALPIVGLLISELISRFRAPAAIALAILATGTCALAVGWATWRPADAENLKVDEVASWLNRDGHDKYRYVTLGFGNKLSRLALLTDAGSVDGEWYSGRTLPELTHFGVGALTSAKYFNEPGLDSLRAMLGHADHYGLKWVIVRDHYYDPLLWFAGWRPVDNLEDDTIVIWSKDGVPPAMPVNSAQMPPRWQGLLWGTLPFGSSVVAILFLLIPAKKRRPVLSDYAYPADEELAPGRLAS